MSFIARMGSAFRNLFRKTQNDKELDAEVRAYVEILAQEKIREGMTLEEARRAARLELGGIEQVKEDVREIRAGAWLDSLLRDLRFGARMLRKNPAFTAIAVLTLALGIGANTAIFSVVDKTIIRPLPYPQPDRLITLWEDFSAFGVPRQRVSPGTFLDWKRRSQTFADLAAYAGSKNINLSGDGPPEEVFAQSVTANLIPLLGIRPLLGRTFSSHEEGPAAKLVVLSFPLWQRRFGGDPNLVGNSIQMNGEKYTVIGIMPKGFAFPDRQTELWVPLGLSPTILARRNSHFLHVVGRLKPGYDLPHARLDMSSVAGSLATEFPDTNARIGITLVPLKDEMLGQSRLAFIILLSAAACVLLIACANVANLLLARFSNRRREIGIRLALGAKRSRIVRQILTESLLLGAAGGALGLLIAHWSIDVLEKMIPATLATSVHLSLDLHVLAFTIAVSIVTGVLFGLAPALQLSQMNLAKRGNACERSRLRSVLVVAEVAIALVLVTGAVLLIETLVQLRAVDPGFRSDSILTANIDVPFPKYMDAAKRQRFYSEVLAHVANVPGVKSAGLTSDLPYTSRGNTMGLTIEGQPAERDLGEDALFRLVSPGYLETIRARLNAGRFLNATDGPASPPVVLINEAFARQYWPNQNPLGHRIDAGTGDGQPRWMTIVGVIADIRERGLDFENKPAVYVPFTQTEIGFFIPSEIALLTSRDPLSLSKELQQAVWSVDSEQPVTIRTMSSIVDDELANRADVLRMLGAFAGLALILAALGIYGLLAYVVSQRTREIGLRMAIGAGRWDVMRTILAYSSRLTMIGVAAGLLGAAAATRLLSALLFGVSPLDWKTLLGVSALLLLVAMVASYLPARRATRIDPMLALRHE